MSAFTLEQRVDTIFSLIVLQFPNPLFQFLEALFDTLDGCLGANEFSKGEVGGAAVAVDFIPGFIAFAEPPGMVSLPCQRQIHEAQYVDE